MSGLAVFVMIVICGIVWGGFAVLIALAVRKEAAKARLSSLP